jgi:UDP-N-acetylmuramyl pentapeptide phosphotransferase/UDP-N-acetylglucosamine-1-phosphate transferase
MLFLSNLLEKLLAPTYVAFSMSFGMAIILVATAPWHSQHSADLTRGIQKLHLGVTPRVGGVAIFTGVGVAYLVSPPDLATILGPLWLAGSAAFIIGFCEDLTKSVSVRARLFATIFSGIVGYTITGVSLRRVGVPLLDPLLSYMFISVIFTSLAAGGVANAINIIDGLNGLASFMVLIALLALAAMAQEVGDPNLAIASLTVAAAVIGFFLVNWPFGKLFLGDGGSYFCGFALAWVGVLLVQRNPSVSPFAVLMACIYPVSEVLFSIYRRRCKNASPGHPDKQHLHSLIYRRYIVSFSPSIKENSLAGILVGFMSIPTSIAGYLLCGYNELAILGCLGFAFCYLIIYRRIVRFGWMKVVHPRFTSKINNR